MCKAKNCMYYKMCAVKDQTNERCEDFVKSLIPEDNIKYGNLYERRKAQVYATGNKWAIENFNATH